MADYATIKAYLLFRACSKNRAKATLGAINGNLINVLICDEALALELLELVK